MRRHRDAGQDRSIGSLLEEMLEEPVMRRGIERARLLDAFSEIAESVLGQGASAACRVVRVIDHAFVIEVSDSIWGQRIQLMSRALLAALRDAGAPSTVTRIRTRPASRQPSVEATAPPPAASPAMPCERCGAMSRTGKFCLACRAEADFWKTALG